MLVAHVRPLHSRYTWQQIDDLYQLTEPVVAPNDFIPRCNIAPTPESASGARARRQAELAMLRRGLIPYWSKDTKIAYKTIAAPVASPAASALRGESDGDSSLCEP
jgi:putative SOS response-associated peptidase YedK